MVNIESLLPKPIWCPDHCGSAENRSESRAKALGWGSNETIGPHHPEFLNSDAYPPIVCADIEDDIHLMYVQQF
jgi:hypothetical protein